MKIFSGLVTLFLCAYSFIAVGTGSRCQRVDQGHDDFRLR